MEHAGDGPMTPVKGKILRFGQAADSPPRFAYAGIEAVSGVARVGGLEFHHMRDVMRLRTGERVTLFDPQAGTECLGRIARFEPHAAVIEIIQMRPGRPAEGEVILAAAIIKGPRMDFLVEKAAELGVTELWPLLCARGVVRNPGEQRLERWRRLAIAAAKQSRAARAMAVRPPMRFAEMVAAVPPHVLRILCAIGAPPLSRKVADSALERVLLACGPEGDFDAAETSAAREAGFSPAGLGPRPLRAETAAIAAVAVANSVLMQRTEAIRK